MTGFTISPLSEIPVSDIVELWNEEIGERFPMSIALWKQNTTNEPNVMKEGSFAVIEEGKPKGDSSSRKDIWKSWKRRCRQMSDGSNACLSEHQLGTRGVGSELLKTCGTGAH